MAKILTPQARIERARKIIKQAKKIPVPDSVGWEHFSYIAHVKETLRKAFELVKLIRYSPSAPEDIKADAQRVIEEVNAAERELLGTSKQD